MTGINVLSLFDGISCGRIALERAGIKVNNYYASEIDKHAIKVSEANYPDIIRLGDVLDWPTWDINWDSIDLVMGGSPCQDFSIARTGLKGELGCRSGISGDKSGLIFCFFLILEYCNPTFFLLENVIMERKYQEFITNRIGVIPIRINSNLVSFQNRDRLYWTNVNNVTVPKDREISFQDYKSKDFNYEKKFKLNRTPSRESMWGNGVNGKCANVTYEDKVKCLTTKQDRWNNSGLVAFDGFCRYLTTQELEAAQTVPEGYCSGLTKNQTEKVLGNGWTVDIISHILKGIENDRICK